MTNLELRQKQLKAIDDVDFRINCTEEHFSNEAIETHESVVRAFENWLENDGLAVHTSVDGSYIVTVEEAEELNSYYY